MAAVLAKPCCCTALQASSKDSPTRQAVPASKRPHSDERGAEQRFRAAIQRAKSAGDVKGECEARLRLSRIAYNQERYSEALRQLMHLERLQRASKQASAARQTKQNQGTVLAAMGLQDKARETYEAVLLEQQEASDERGQARALNSLGVDSWKRKDYGKARGFYERALEIQTRLKNQRGQATLLNNLGMIAQVEDRNEDAMRAYRRSLEIKKAIGSKRGTALTWSNIATLHTKAKEFKEAEECLEKAVRLAKSQNKLKVLRSTWQVRADLLSAQGKHEAALAALETYLKLTKKALGRGQAAELARLRAELLVSEKNEELQRLRAENASHKADAARAEHWNEHLVLYLSLFVLISVVTGAYLYSWIRNARVLRARNAELEASREHIRLLEGILPICCVCKKVRQEDGSWRQIEAYIGEHTDAQFSHGYCPHCLSEAIDEVESAAQT